MMPCSGSRTGWPVSACCQRSWLTRWSRAEPLSALAGAGAVLILGLALGRRRERLRWAPSLFLALAPGFVNLCHFATPEAWLFLGSAATLALALAHLEGRASALSLGLALGLTASTNYTAPLCCCRAPGTWLAPQRRRARPALLAALGGVAIALGAVLAGGGTEALAGRLPLAGRRLLLPSGRSSSSARWSTRR